MGVCPLDVVICCWLNCVWKCVCSYLYQIAHLGDDDEEPEFSSAMPLEEGDTFFFAPRALKNLVMVDEMDSLSPVMHCQVSSHHKLLSIMMT
jgi:hypothetical protein